MSAHKKLASWVSPKWVKIYGWIEKERRRKADTPGTRVGPGGLQAPPVLADLSVAGHCFH